MKIITLLTDFGTKDSYAAEMKGVMISFIPDIRIIDISHNVKPHSILEASFILSNSFYYFPERTVHLVVVDPGVGTDRSIVKVKTTHYTFIAPDNGVLFESVNKDGILDIRSIDINKFRRYMLDLYKDNIVAENIFSKEVSRTFHGRDIFAPLAVFSLLEEDWDLFSLKKNSLTIIEQYKPIITDKKIIGKIIYIDHFGNLITNVSSDLINNYQKLEIFIKLGNKATAVGSLKNTYSDVKRGKVLALIDSRGYLEIAVNSGDASRYFNTSGTEDILIILSS